MPRGFRGCAFRRNRVCAFIRAWAYKSVVGGNLANRIWLAQWASISTGVLNPKPRGINSERTQVALGDSFELPVLLHKGS